MSTRRYFIVFGLCTTAALWGIGFLIHGLPGEDWLNWKGWSWIVTPINFAIGGWYGWSVRGQHDQHRRWREELDRTRERP